MTYRMFEPEGFHMHSIEFLDSQVSIKYTHREDASEDVAVTKEVHISTSTSDEQLQYWINEMLQATEELVAHTQRHLKQSQPLRSE